MENAIVGVQDRYFEDFRPGQVLDVGTVKVDESEMLEYARRYDPQAFHVDPAAAKQTIYGGLIASGWFTCSLMMRLFYEQYLPRAASLGSPGIDELRWLRPVRAGDELHVRVTVEDARRSRSKPDRGIVHSFVEVFNQNGEKVMTMRVINLFKCRNP